MPDHETIKRLPSLEREILEILILEGPTSSPNLSKALQVTPSAIHTAYKGLLAAGTVNRTIQKVTDGGRPAHIFHVSEEAVPQLLSDFSLEAAKLAERAERIQTILESLHALDPRDTSAPTQ